MHRYLFVIFIIIYLTIVESSCPQPAKFYVDCSGIKTLTYAVQTCNRYGMTLLNLTNSSSLTADIGDLNHTLVSTNCYNNFWFASRNGTGYIGSATSLGEILTGLLAGTLNLVLGLVANLLSCLLIFCPFTTTPAPITQAIIVCTRPVQQRVIQKCLTQSVRPDMRTFQFSEQQLYGGILDSFASRSRTICIGLCSEQTQCIGISYIGGICSLYI